MGNSIASSMVLKTLERYSVLVFQMLVQIVVARILTPNDYGIVAMMSVFISIASIFINNGFNMAVIQKQDATTRDFGTALLLNLCIGTFFYIILFLTSPYIAKFYNQPELIKTLRVLALILPIGSVSSIQIAVATRNMQFSNLFKCNLAGSIFAGVVGITCALCGMGYWGLIAQQIVSCVVIAIMLTYHATWKPKFDFVSSSAKEMFSFGWKLLAAGLLNQLYTELNSLIIGKKYLPSDLAFYNKGKQFPSMITTGLDSAIQSVSLSALSKRQDDKVYIHSLIHKTLISNSYILFPALTIFAFVAHPLVVLILTEKWLPVIPYIQICCFTFAFHPMAALDMQVLAAIGRSDLRLKLEFIKKPIGILLLVLAIPYGPISIAISAAITSIVSLAIGAIACSKCVGYTVWAHFRDILPILVVSLISGFCVFFIDATFTLSPLSATIVEGGIGVIVYIALSFIFNIEGLSLIKSHLKFKK